MSRPALYLGEACPPNMEAYLDSLLYRTSEHYTLVVTEDCSVPDWFNNHDRLTVAAFPGTTRSGSGRIKTAFSITRTYLSENSPTELRQITQPRWHALGVLLGAIGSGTPVATRASASMFSEYRTSPNKIKAWLANNVIGRSVFMSDRVFTPEYGGLDVPWYSSADVVTEQITVNKDRFDPAIVDPRSELFEQSDHRVLTVGRVSKHKGIDLLIDVADELADFEFSVVGPVADETLAKKARKQPNLSLYDPVPYIEMPGLYAACDTLLSTSRIEWGGFSRAMMEAKAMDRPVVALDHGYANRFADKVVPEDPSIIADALRTVLN